MNWITIEDNLKPEEGQHIVSASKGNKRFFTTAIYKDNSWRSYEPFSEKIGEDITDNIKAWAKDIGVFIG